MIAQRLLDVRNRIKVACNRCGRNSESVQLVAVTKTFGAERVRQAIEAGQVDFGENYVQELRTKRQELQMFPVRWHFIGHLQTNKVKYIAEYVHLIHSVDNVRVAEEIQRFGDKIGRSLDVLIEIHSTDEATKSGVLPEHAASLIKGISRLSRVNVLGLMTMGPFSDDPNDSRPAFRLLAELSKRIDSEGIDRVSMRHLSMGMTHDFEVAIEEGATIIRIGTAIFGRRMKDPNEQSEATQ